MNNKNEDSQMSTLSKRTLLKALSVSPLMLQAFPWGLSSAYAQSPKLSVTKLNPSMQLITGAGCNVLVKQAGADLLVVDGGVEQNSELLLKTIHGLVKNSKISTLVNTHWHREHTGLNELLGQQGAAIFSHINTQQWSGAEIKRPWDEVGFDPLPAVAQPNKTFYHYGDFAHGDSLVQYGYLRQAHTDGDMYMYFPDDNVLHGGGVVSNDGWPLMDWWTGGWIGGLVDGLEVLLSLANDDTTIVPANGPVMTKQELQDMRDMYATVFGRVRTSFMSAYSPQETVDAQPAAEFAARWGNPDAFIMLSYQSLIPHYTPDA